MKCKKMKYGISLIVLVITIIVMIILALAVIISLINNGIIGKSNQAVNETNLKQVQTIAATIWSEGHLDGLDPEMIKNKIVAAIGENADKYNIEVNETGVTITQKNDKQQSSVPTKWQENVIEVTDDGVPIPIGFVASPYEDEDEIEEGLVIYELDENEQAIPEDEEQFESWTKRNQFVWVPVNTSTFEKSFVHKEFGMGYTRSKKLGSGYWEVELDETTNMPNLTQNDKYMSQKTLEEVQNMYKSVKEYGGFYIARYETGIDKPRTKSNYISKGVEKQVYSMMGKMPYTYVMWSNSTAMNIDTGGAVEVSRNFYSSENSMRFGVNSTLVYSVQWDAILSWWLTDEAVSSVVESSDYGNYINHVISDIDSLNKDAKVFTYSNGEATYVDAKNKTYPKQSGVAWGLSTGALKAANVNNIYDLAGNVWEWTMEGYSTDSHASRGGYYGNVGQKTKYPAAYLGNDYNTEVAYSAGFRMALYIKLPTNI